MSYETLDFSVAAGVATITLNRPANMNAMSPQMGAELHAAALQIDANQDVRHGRLDVRHRDCVQQPRRAVDRRV